MTAFRSATVLLSSAILSAAALASSNSATAQGGQAAPASNVSQRYIEVYGDDACPPSTPGEIVVCARKPESERYRIPPAFRSQPGNGPNESWANKAQALEYVGQSGTDSCSASGGGGWTGCWAKLMQKAEAEHKQAIVDDANIP